MKQPRALLVTQGYRVLTAPNGKEALKCTDEDKNPVVLVISDIVLPGMGGFDLYKALINCDQEIKMLFLSGHPIEDGTRNMLKMGNVQWIQNPSLSLNSIK